LDRDALANARVLITLCDLDHAQVNVRRQDRAEMRRRYSYNRASLGLSRGGRLGACENVAAVGTS